MLANTAVDSVAELFILKGSTVFLDKIAELIEKKVIGLDPIVDSLKQDAHSSPRPVSEAVLLFLRMIRKPESNVAARRIDTLDHNLHRYARLEAGRGSYLAAQVKVFHLYGTFPVQHNGPHRPVRVR